MSSYKKTLSEPWFSLIKLGIKKVEGRLNKGDFKEMKIGDSVTFTNNDFKEREFTIQVVKKTEYKSFDEYLSKEGLETTLPGIDTIEEGLSVYYKYFSKEDEKTYGVIAVSFKIPRERVEKKAGRSRSKKRSKSARKKI
jgi:ASC-1-like (ASCH) protein